MSDRPLLFVDVETTGLTPSDRVVSMGLVRVEHEDQFQPKDMTASACYAIFNPGVPSHPRARKVHGFADDFLAHQDPFEALASDLQKYFANDPLVIAHNSSFDERFMRAEFEAAGVAIPAEQFFCTMREYRRHHEGSAAIKAILPKLGLKRAGATHGALEDAWLAMQIYCHLRGLPVPVSNDIAYIQPLNLRTPTVERITATQEPTEKTPELSANTKEILTALKPMSTILMAIARADNDFSNEEVKVLLSLIEDEANHLDISLSGDEHISALSYFSDIDPSETDISAACQEIAKSEHLMSLTPVWLKEMTYSDGKAAQEEADVIQSIAAEIKKARQAG